MMKSYPFNSKNVGSTSSPEWDRAITAEDERQFNKLYFTNGVFANPPNSLMVRPGGGMKIEVSPGGCHIEGAKAYSTESRYITLSNSDSQLSRIDRVLVRFDLAEAVRSIEIYVREGVPSTTPRPPEIHRESTYYELVLADVLVKSGTNSISSSQITDQRLNPDLCGMVVPLADQKDTSELWGQIKDSIELVNASLDGTTAGKLEGRISEVEAGLDSKITNVKRDVTSTKSDVVDVQNDLEKIAKKLEKDWIVETSTQDGWEVEKWHSGKMVQTLYKATDNVGWNDIPYMTGLIVSHKTYTFPQHFIGIPVVSASVTGGSGIGVGVTTHPTNNDVQLHVTGSQSCKGSGAKDIAIIAIGKWK